MNNIVFETSEKSWRIDKYLAKKNPAYSRADFGRFLKSGLIKINGKKVKLSYILISGDIISFENIPSPTNDTLEPNDKLNIEVLFENEDFLVINKPAGIQVHPSAIEKSSTVANWALAHIPEITQVHDDSIEGPQRPGIVHRLDKDTSGVMIIAKNQKSFHEFKHLFSTRKISKTYAALVYGCIEKEEGRIDASISRSASRNKQTSSARRTSQKIREAITEYKVIKRWKNYSLLEVHPLTGRMHQIRVHCLHIGYPIIGDLKYFKRGKLIKNKPARHLLHAKSISFELFGEKYNFKAPLPEDFESFMNNIEPAK